MIRTKSIASAMQKTYDDCYLICSTAVYFESQNNEPEALRSWRNALDQIYYHNAYRVPATYQPRSETEKALQDSLRDMEAQCKERVDLLEALKKSRLEAETGASPNGEKKPSSRKVSATKAGGSGNGSSSSPSASKSSRSGGGAAVGSSGLTTLPPPPALSAVPKAAPVPTMKYTSADRTQPQPVSRGHAPDLALPASESSKRQSRTSRTPSPEKKGGMLRTLRQQPKEGKTASGKNISNLKNRPPAAAKAATQAWIPNNPSLQVNAQGSTPSSPSSSAALPSARRSFDLANDRRHSKEAAAASTQRPGFGQRMVSSESTHRVPPYPTEPQHVSDNERLAKADLRRNLIEERRKVDALHYPPANGLMPDLPILPPKRSSLERKAVGSASATPEPPDPLSHNIPRKLPSSKPPPVPPHRIKPNMGVTAVPSLGVSSLANNTTSSRNADLDRPMVPDGVQARIPPKLQPQLSPPASDSDASPMEEDEEDAWQKKSDQVMKNLPRGVDAGAAKQILNDIVIHGDEVHWDDVAGLDIAKSALKETVVYPFLRPDLFMGLREPARGMLLFGPPGTGKTMLARAVATESRSTFFAISASSLTSKFLGESEKLVRALFALAKAMAPSIIFVDEIDSLLSSRAGSSEHEATRRIKTEFLIQWSDLAKAAAGRETEKDKERGDASRVLVLAATNMPWAIDEAARRRFVRRQYIPLPEEHVRRMQLDMLLSHQKHSLNDFDLRTLVALTEGFSGSDITALAKDAAMGPLRSLGEKLLHMNKEDIRSIGFDDFEASLITIRPSVSRAGLKEYEDWARDFGERGG